jgi:hypothetical protein
VTVPLTEHGITNFVPFPEMSRPLAPMTGADARPTSIDAHATSASDKEQDEPDQELGDDPSSGGERPVAQRALPCRIALAPVEDERDDQRDQRKEERGDRRDGDRRPGVRAALLRGRRAGSLGFHAPILGLP